MSIAGAALQKSYYVASKTPGVGKAVKVATGVAVGGALLASGGYYLYNNYWKTKETPEPEPQEPLLSANQDEKMKTTIENVQKYPQKVEKSATNANEYAEKMTTLHESLASYVQQFKSITENNPAVEVLVSGYIEKLETLSVSCKNYADGSQELSNVIDAIQNVFESSSSVHSQLICDYYDLIKDDSTVKNILERYGVQLDGILERIRQIKQTLLGDNTKQTIQKEEVLKILNEIEQSLSTIFTLDDKNDS